MRRNEQLIVVGLVVVVLLAGFWLLILSPKRNQASELEDQVGQLRTSLAEAQQQVAAGEKAKRSFRIDYRRLVVLGKAVPSDGEQASLLVQLQNLAERSGVEFRTIDLGSGGDTTEVAPPPPATPAPAPSDTSSTDTSTSSTASSSTDTSTSSTASSSTGTTATAAVPASEAFASMLPIGASVGPAGLPVMPYDLTFTGQFFQIADFMERLDGMVHMRKGLVDVKGRLLTVNGFTLEPVGSDPVPTPELTAHLNVTTYLTPADQGITAGATPSGPAPATSASPTTVSSPAPSSGSTTTPTDTTASTTP